MFALAEEPASGAPIIIDRPGNLTQEYQFPEGTIILSDGEWALVELPEHNFPEVDWRFRKRVWVELSNLMY